MDMEENLWTVWYVWSPITRSIYSPTNAVMKSEWNYDIKNCCGIRRVLCCHSHSDGLEASGWSGSRPATWLEFSWWGSMSRHSKTQEDTMGWITLSSADGDGPSRTMRSSNQGGPRIKMEYLGLNFFVKPSELDLPTYVIRHISIWKYDIISLIILILYPRQMPRRLCIPNFVGVSPTKHIVSGTKKVRFCFFLLLMTLCLCF